MFRRGRGASRSARALLGAIGLCVVACTRTYAGAYLYPAGQGQIIVTTTFTQAGGQFDRSGKFIPTAQFRKLEATAYAEIGVTDWFTAVIKPSITDATFPSGSSMVQANSTGSEIGGRVRLATWNDLTFALQADGVLPSLNLDHNTALLTDASGGADMRALVGYGFRIGSWPSFVDLDFGYRWHVGNPPSEWRGDLTLGTRPLPMLLILLQSFNTISDGRGLPPFTRYRQNKLQASIVYDLNVWSLQLGVLTTIAGANTPRERGGLAAVWRRF
ncbi:MAG: hypothetical protein JO366_15955 [Methylobacteriaceae bacterium]|nr:hypothetical protein [Methylobacteriaceae bacterium]MBV9635503.1 hypothetical protein [Methylobacteriaceae bacterium]